VLKDGCRPFDDAGVPVGCVVVLGVVQRLVQQLVLKHQTQLLIKQYHSLSLWLVKHTKQVIY